MESTLRDTVSVRVPRDLWEQIKQLAEREERTVQTVTTRLLRSGLNAALDRGRGTHA